MDTKIQLDNAEIWEGYHRSQVIKTIRLIYHNKTTNLDQNVDFKISYCPDETKDMFKVDFLCSNKKYFETLKEAREFCYKMAGEYYEQSINQEEEIKKFIEKTNKRKHKKVEE